MRNYRPFDLRILCVGELIVSQRKPQILPRLNLAAAMVNGRSDQCRRARDPTLAQRVGKGGRMVEICLKRGEAY